MLLAAGICTVFGDPHYKTFDGKFYSFQGSCKYQLTADCINHSFSIRVTNDARNTKSSAWTKTVTLKIGNLKVNLGQKMRVKVNGTRVNLPFTLHSLDMLHSLLNSQHSHPHDVGIHHNNLRHQKSHHEYLPHLGNAIMRNISSNEIPEPPLLDITMTEDGVSVNTRIGIKVLWDGTNFLQVQAPVSYKRKLCGLCGNYNSVSRDDLQTRRGLSLDETNIWRFANSWRVGGTKSCTRNNENFGRQSTCKYRKKWPLCKPLKDPKSIFGNCTGRLNPTNYFESCRKDMCECDSDRCFCESFAAYAHECQRLGVPLNNWRQETGCSLRNMMMMALSNNRISTDRSSFALVTASLPREELHSPIVPKIFKHSSAVALRKQHHIEDGNKISNSIRRERKRKKQKLVHQSNNKPKMPRRNRTPPPIQ